MLLRTYSRLLALFDRRERRNFFALCGLMVVSGLVETTGVASIIPFLTIVAEPSIVESNALFQRLYALSGATRTGQFMAIVGSAVFCVFLLGLIVKALTAYALYRFSSRRSYSLSVRLLGKYLRQPYEWFLFKNSADLAKIVLTDIDVVVGRALIPSLSMLRGAMVTVFIVMLMIAVDPAVAAIAALVLGSCYAVIYRSVRAYLGHMGERRTLALRQRYRIAQEAFGGFKEIKTLGSERHYVQRFMVPSLEVARADVASRLIGELPRHALEAVAFGGMLILVVTKLSVDEDGLTALLPTLGLYAFAGVRLFPALQQIYVEAASLRYAQPVLQRVFEELHRPDPPEGAGTAPTERIRVNRSIELVDVAYAYPGAERRAVDGISLTIPARSTVGFVGGTGAGKSTVIDIVMGLLAPGSGTLRVDGQPVHDANVRAWRRSVGYVPQQIFLADDTVAANIAFGIPPGAVDMAAVERAARIAELHRFVTEDMPRGYATVVGERGVRLSGGQRQRIGIARALYHDPDVLVLDEATSALDNITEQAVMQAVQNLGRSKTIVIIAHRLSTVRGCDEIFMLERGRLAGRGSYDALIAGNDAFRRLAGSRRGEDGPGATGSE